MIFALFFLWHESAAQVTFASEKELKKEAESRFEARDYHGALPLYSQLLSLYAKDPVYNYRYGVCAIYADKDKAQAIQYLKFASTRTSEAPMSAHFYLGKAYHINYQFDKALDSYRRYKQSAKKKDADELLVDLHINMANNAKNMPRAFRKLEVLESTEVPEGDFHKSYNLSDYGGKALDKPDDFRTPLDRKNEDKSLLYLSDANNVILYSSYGDNGKTGRDIYRKVKIGGGTWSDPQRLSDVINTPYDEAYPYLSQDGKKLYFSSMGHNSMGGYDIFVSTLDPQSGEWSKPVNLGEPINTPGNDVFFVANDDNETAWYASDIKSTIGNLVVYKAQMHLDNRLTSVLRGKFINNIRPTEKEVKISIYNIDTGELVDTQTSSRETGEYIISLASDTKYRFIVEGELFDADTVMVVIPPRKDNQNLRQDIVLAEIGGERSLKLKNYFSVVEDEAVTSNDVDTAGSRLGTVEEQQVYTRDLTNEEIIESAEKRAAQLDEEAKELAKKAEIAFSVAKHRSKLAKDLITMAENESDEEKKQQLNLLAEEKKKESVVAFSIANQLKKEKEDKQFAADLAKTNAAQIKKAVESNSVEEALAILEDLKKQLDEQEAKEEMSVLAEIEGLKKTLKKKQEEVVKASENANTLRDRKNDLEQQAVRYREAAVNTKKKKEQEELIAKAEYNESEAEEVAIQLEIADKKAKKLQSEAKKLESELAYSTNVVEDVNYGVPDYQASDVWARYKSGDGSVPMREYDDDEIADNNEGYENVTDDGQEEYADDEYNEDAEGEEGINDDSTPDNTAGEYNDNAATVTNDGIAGNDNESNDVDATFDNEEVVDNNNVVPVDNEDITDEAVSTSDDESENPDNKEIVDSPETEGQEITSDDQTQANDYNDNYEEEYTDIPDSDNIDNADNSDDYEYSDDIATSDQNNVNDEGVNDPESGQTEYEYADGKTENDNTTDDGQDNDNNLRDYADTENDTGENVQPDAIEDNSYPIEPYIAPSFDEQAVKEVLDENEYRNYEVYKDRSVESQKESIAEYKTADQKMTSARAKLEQATDMLGELKEIDDPALREEKIAEIEQLKQEARAELDQAKYSHSTAEAKKRSAIDDMESADNYVRDLNSSKYSNQLVVAEADEDSNPESIGGTDPAELEDYFAALDEQLVSVAESSSSDLAVTDGTPSNVDNSGNLPENEPEAGRTDEIEGSDYSTDNTQADEENITPDRGYNNQEPDIADAIPDNGTQANNPDETGSDVDDELTNARDIEDNINDDEQNDEIADDASSDLTNNETTFPEDNESAAPGNDAVRGENNTNGYVTAENDEYVVADTPEQITPPSDQSTTTSPSPSGRGVVKIEVLPIDGSDDGQEGNNGYVTENAPETEDPDQPDLVTEVDESPVTEVDDSSSDDLVVDNLTSTDDENDITDTDPVTDVVDNINDQPQTGDEPTGQENATSDNESITRSYDPTPGQESDNSDNTATVPGQQEGTTSQAGTSVSANNNNRSGVDLTPKLKVNDPNYLKKDIENEAAIAGALQNGIQALQAEIENVRTQTQATSDPDQQKQLQARESKLSGLLALMRKALEYNNEKRELLANRIEHQSEEKVYYDPQFIKENISENEHGNYRAYKGKQDINEKEAEQRLDRSKDMNTVALEKSTQALEILKDIENITDSTVYNQQLAKVDDLLKEAGTENENATREIRLAKMSLRDATDYEQKATEYIADLDATKYNNALAEGKTTREATEVADIPSEPVPVRGTEQAGTPSNQNQRNIEEPVADNQPVRSTSSVRTQPAGVAEVFAIKPAVVYSRSAPIPVDAELPEGVIFKVQVGAFRNPIEPSTFGGISPLVGETTPSGLTRYTAGVFRALNAAISAKNQIVGLGYRDAFVVAYYNGKRLSISEALARLQGGSEEERFAYENRAAQEDQIVNSAGSSVSSQVSADDAVEIINAASGPTSLTSRKGLLFTVQVGVYSRPVSASQLYNLDPLYNERTDNGYIRYGYGIYNDLDNAGSARQEAINRGVSDAFVVAYFNGKKISISEARQMLERGDVQLADLSDTPANTSTFVSNTEENSTNTATDDISSYSLGDVVYRVQIGAYRNQVPLEVVTQYLKVVNRGIQTFDGNDGMKIFAVGSFADYNSANDMKQQLVNDGVEGAFITYYIGNRKLTSGEYEQLKNQ